MENHYYATGFLYDPTEKQVLLHKRDKKAKFNPQKWALFGGGDELEDKNNPLNTFVREIREELGISLLRKEIIFLYDYPINNLGFRRYIFYAEKYLPKSKMKLGEGEDFSWVRLEDAFGLDLTERARQDLLMFQKQIAQ